MLRFLFRALGFLLVTVAFAALVVDGTRSIAGGHLMQYSLAETVAWLGGAQAAALVDGLHRLPEPVRQVASSLLAVPGWAASGFLGLVLLYVGRPATARIGLPSRRA